MLIQPPEKQILPTSVLQMMVLVTGMKRFEKRFRAHDMRARVTQEYLPLTLQLEPAS